MKGRWMCPHTCSLIYMLHAPDHELCYHSTLWGNVAAVCWTFRFHMQQATTYMYNRYWLDRRTEQMTQNADRMTAGWLCPHLRFWQRKQSEWMEERMKKRVAKGKVNFAPPWPNRTGTSRCYWSVQPAPTPVDLRVIQVMHRPVGGVAIAWISKDHEPAAASCRGSMLHRGTVAHVASLPGVGSANLARSTSISRWQFSSSTRSSSWLKILFGSMMIEGAERKGTCHCAG